MIVKRIVEKEKKAVLVPETGIDLINLYRVTSVGDEVYSETTREVKKQRRDGTTDSERIRLKIGIEVEKKSLDPLSRRANFHGRIISVQGGELEIEGRYHTIHVGVGWEIELVSRDNFWKLVKLSEHSRASKDVKPIACLSIDDERADLFLLTERGIERIASVADPLSMPPKASGLQTNKVEPKAMVSLFDELERLVRESSAELVVIGPEVIVDLFVRRLKREGGTIFKELKRRVITSSGGEEGLREAMRRGELGEGLKPLRDVVTLERVLKAMVDSDMRIYLGIEEVFDAFKKGDLGLVLLSEEFIWNNADDERVEEVLEGVEEARLEAIVLSSGSESEDSLRRLGGVLGIPASQRYRIGRL